MKRQPKMTRSRKEVLGLPQPVSTYATKLAERRKRDGKRPLTPPPHPCYTGQTLKGAKR